MASNGLLTAIEDRLTAIQREIDTLLPQMDAAQRQTRAFEQRHAKLFEAQRVLEEARAKIVALEG